MYQGTCLRNLAGVQPIEVNPRTHRLALGGRFDIDSRPHLPVLIDDFECATSQGRRILAPESWMTLSEEKDEKGQVGSRESNEERLKLSWYSFSACAKAAARKLAELLANALRQVDIQQRLVRNILLVGEDLQIREQPLGKAREIVRVDG